jgi:hypothetical protein
VILLVSGATKTYRPRIEARPESFGTLITPADGGLVPPFGKWAADNGAFKGFDAEAFRRMLSRLEDRRRCLFVTAPDVVGDAASTASLFREWREEIAERRFPVAYVIQDGATVSGVPWDEINAVFVGGSTAYKLGGAAAEIVRTAKALRRWVHMGRVNTRARLRYAASIGCDSVDGSGFSKFPDSMLERHGATIEDLGRQRRIAFVVASRTKGDGR